jgi:glycosyltransferase involved in cell wall biosynthesis
MNSNKIKLSVVVPVYNENKTVIKIVNKILKIKNVLEIIIVDDGSQDGTRSTLRKISINKKVRVFTQKKNLGKGAAIRLGLKNIKGNYVIVQDADLEYDPQDYQKLIKPVLDGKAEVVYGSRFLGEHRNMFFWHMLCNKLLTLLTNILFDTTLSDMETCYKLMPAKLFEKIKIKSNGFDFEPEITAKILKRGIRIYEVPISYAGREYDEGKKIRFHDAIIALLMIIKYRFIN